MSTAGDTSLSWEDLPLKYGEDSREWNNLMARYSHIGCPGCQYEDNCYKPSDCASKGRCRLTYQKWQDHDREANKTIDLVEQERERQALGD